MAHIVWPNISCVQVLLFSCSWTSLFPSIPRS